MTGKERIYTTLQHKEPDRVPVMEYIFEHGIIEQLLGRGSFWRAHFKEVKAYWEGRRDEVVEGQKKDIVEFVRELNLDGVTVSLVPPKGFKPNPLEKIGEDTWRDWEGNVYRYSPLTEDIGLIAEKALEPKSPPEEMWEAPKEIDPSEFELVDHVVSELGGTHFIVARCGRRADLGYINPFHFEERLIRFVENPEDVRNERIDGAKESYKLISLIFSHGVDAIILEEDFGDSTGPMISPKTFRECILPGLKIMCGHIKSYGKPVIFHSCGKNRVLLDMFIEAGIDCYQSIQHEEDIISLKRDFGKKLSLWGGINIDHLIRKRPEEVRKEVGEVILGCKPGGGFILGSSHSLMPGTKLENYLAVLDELNRVGWY